jgi:hypothetical protein
MSLREAFRIIATSKPGIYAPFKIVLDEAHANKLFDYRAATKTLFPQIKLYVDHGASFLAMSATPEMDDLGPQMDTLCGEGGWRLMQTSIQRPNLKRVIYWLPDNASSTQWFYDLFVYLRDVWYPLVGIDLEGDVDPNHPPPIVIISTHTVATATWVCEQINGTTSSSEGVGEWTQFADVLGSAVLYHGKLSSELRAKALSELGSADPDTVDLCEKFGKAVPRAGYFTTIVGTFSSLDTGFNNSRVHVTAQGENIPMCVALGDQHGGRGGRKDQPSLDYKVVAPRYLSIVAHKLMSSPWQRTCDVLQVLETYCSTYACVRQTVYSLLAPPHKWGGDRDRLLRSREHEMPVLPGSSCCCYNCSAALRVQPRDCCLGVFFGDAASILIKELSAAAVSPALKRAPAAYIDGVGANVMTYVSVYAMWMKIVRNDSKCIRAGCLGKFSTVCARGFVLIMRMGILRLHVWETIVEARADQPQRMQTSLGLSPVLCLAAENIRRGTEGLFMAWGIVNTGPE